MWTLKFWKAVAERAVSTIAQAGLAAIGVSATLEAIDWKVIGSVAAVAGVLSVLKSLVAQQIGNKGPSLTSSEELTP